MRWWWKLWGVQQLRALVMEVVMQLGEVINETLQSLKVEMHPLP